MERIARHNRSRLHRGVLLALSALILGGCSTIPFYAQSISGHLRLLSAREPVDQLLAGSSLDEKSRRRLERAKKIRQFASEELALPDNDSYKS